MTTVPSVQVLDWARGHGLKIPGYIQVQYVSGQGCGLFASKDLVGDHVVLEVPFHLALTICRARQSPIGPILSELGAPAKTIMHFWLIYEKFTESSFFGPYLRALSSTFSDPTWWKDYSFLEGTNMFAAVNDRLKSIQRDLVKFGQPLSQYHPDVFPSELCTIRNIRWAYSVLCSRGFPARLAGLDDAAAEGVGCLLPVADYFNHSLSGSSTVQNWHVTSTTVQFRGLAQSGFEARAGQQMFTNYGAKSNEEFLMGYGFTLQNNPHDHVAIKLSLPVPDDPHADFQGQLLSRLPSAHYLQRSYPLPDSLLQAVSISLMTPIEAYTLPIHYSPDVFVNHEHECAIYETLETLMRLARDRLPGNLTVHSLDVGSDLTASQRCLKDINDVGQDVCNYVQGQYDILTDSIAALRKRLGPVQSVKDVDEQLLDYLDFSVANGIVIKRALQAGDVIVRIPYSELVSHDADTEEFGPELTLALYLLQRQMAKDPVILSLLSPNSTLIWSKDEVDQLGSDHVPVVALTHERIAEAELLYEQVRGRFGTYFPALPEFIRALVTAASHIVTLRDGTAAMPLRLPALPLHSTTPNATFIDDPETGYLQLVAKTCLCSGSIVTVTRSRCLTNAELLVQYGQVVDANPFDTLELDLVASEAFADNVDIYCSDIPDIAHGFVLGCPGGVPERLTRDLDCQKVGALLQAAYAVLGVTNHDLITADSHTSGSVQDLILRYRGQLAALLCKVKCHLAALSSERSPIDPSNLLSDPSRNH